MIKDGNQLQEKLLRRFLPFVLIALGLFLLIGAVLLLANRSAGARSEIPMPESIARLRLTDAMRGEEALAEIAQMHRGEFTIVGGAIGIYGPARQAMLWAAGANDETGVDRLLAAMRVEIARGGTPFTPVKEWQDGRRTVYELEGLGQEHFYFRSGRLLVWLAVDEKDALQAIIEILAFYP